MRIRQRFISFLGFTLLFVCGRSAQAQSAAAPPKAPEVSAADVASVDSIIDALYDVISGPAGKSRDWQRMRSLFAPGARLVRISPNPQGGFWSRTLSVEDYISSADSFFKANGFLEKEVHRQTESFGHLVEIFSTYESRHAPDDRKLFARGINSIQLMNDGQRWWVVTIMWEEESAEIPIPAKYLPK